ncbi:3-keto-5-aminohexanoate cleavage protein [Vineibacter terrae]|uniref:3-keto-5-aminohexanoate cleavage protein n=1 Tax=Vineibacter terrae TaxID=2586908 RepID=UPI002E31EE4E|nr:3-keto-5-aminohexanoate cleavage protein [Vineibacter terrae]HEX2886487.1 3-keto-5-aminohexanoate cleavage protein [Vineibacter terrae]
MALSRDLSASPVIIEAAINGARTKADNPNVPLAAQEIVDCITACVEAGASIIHMHAGQPIVGAGGHHDSAMYRDVFMPALQRHPGLLIYPTLPGGGAGTTMQQRLSHVRELAEMGLAGPVPVDPGTMNLGRIGRHGRPPANGHVYQTTFADVDWAFRFCNQASLPCTLSAFEPGFVRLVEAHRRAGTLPAAAIVKLEFGADEVLFGLKPGLRGLEAWLDLFDGDALAWMVSLRDGDVNDLLAGLAIERGGHVRVGIEDYRGPAMPRNEELIAATVRIARGLGRRPARLDEVRGLITVKFPL